MQKVGCVKTNHLQKIDQPFAGDSSAPPGMTGVTGRRFLGFARNDREEGRQGGREIGRKGDREEVRK